MIIKEIKVDYKDQKESIEALEEEYGEPVHRDNEFVSLRANSDFFDDVHDFCFLCGEQLLFPVVMWHGTHGVKVRSSQEIWLHPECAKRLSFELMKDYQKTIDIST